jgi:hypothetical protein
MKIGGVVVVDLSPERNAVLCLGAEFLKPAPISSAQIRAKDLSAPKVRLDFRNGLPIVR